MDYLIIAAIIVIMVICFTILRYEKKKELKYKEKGLTFYTSVEEGMAKEEVDKVMKEQGLTEQEIVIKEDNYVWCEDKYIAEGKDKIENIEKVEKGILRAEYFKIIFEDNKVKEKEIIRL